MQVLGDFSRNCISCVKAHINKIKINELKCFHSVTENAYTVLYPASSLYGAAEIETIMEILKISQDVLVLRTNLKSGRCNI